MSSRTSLEVAPLPSDSESDEWEHGSSNGIGNGLEENYRLEKPGTKGQNAQHVSNQWDQNYDIEKPSRYGRRKSNETEQSFMLYTPDEERSVIKKFDRRLVMFIALLYMLSFLDRSSMLPVVFDWN